MNVRRWAIGGMSAVGGVLVAAATAWACVSGPAVNLSTVNAKPGQEVQLTGSNFTKSDPVTVRWNALDGPVLATLDAPNSERTIAGAFTVPADAKPGNYILIVTQSDAQGKITQMPVRALLTVVPENGANPVLGGAVSPTDQGRPVGLVTSDDSISGVSLLLIGLGVAGVGMFVAGMAALFAGRRGQAPEAVRARS
jgi:hypothetical protein